MTDRHDSRPPSVVKLANEVARHFEHLPHPEAVQAFRDHIASFWEARMRTRLAQEAVSDPSRLHPVVLDTMAEDAEREQ